jgi:hypothetical protein
MSSASLAVPTILYAIENSSGLSSDLALSHRLVVWAHTYECNHARRTQCSS